MFSGKVTQGVGVTYYTVTWNDEVIPLCPDPLFKECGVEYMPYTWGKMTYTQKVNCIEQKSFSWGYEGNGSELLAVSLLGIYGAPYWVGNIRSHLSGGGPRRASLNSIVEQRAFVKKHYKAFATEVIANLPDNWTMTMEDIDRWVKEQETKPK